MRKVSTTVTMILSIIVSLIISILINFNAYTFSGFLIGTLILGASLFGILFTLVTKKQRKIWLPISIVIAFFTILSVSKFMSPCSNLVTPAHFRTNTFTGECEFGGYFHCLVPDPWYYSSDCDLSEDDKIEIIKNSKENPKIIEECKGYCEKDSSNNYCRGSHRIKFTDVPYSCEHFYECESMSCEEYLKKFKK